jgi:hypothetical protein
VVSRLWRFTGGLEFELFYGRDLRCANGFGIVLSVYQGYRFHDSNCSNQYGKFHLNRECRFGPFRAVDVARQSFTGGDGI